MDRQTTQQTMHLYDHDKIGFAVFTGNVDSGLCYTENVSRLQRNAEKFVVDLRRVVDVADIEDFRECLVDLRKGGKRVVLCGNADALETMLQLHELEEPFEICASPDIAENLLKEPAVELVA